MPSHTVHTPVNQNGDVVPIGKKNASEKKYNIQMTSTAQVVEKIWDSAAVSRSFQISCSVPILWMLALGDSETLTGANADGYLNDGLPYEIVVPGITSTTTADQWHLYVMINTQTTTETTGYVVLRELT